MADITLDNSPGNGLTVESLLDRISLAIVTMSSGAIEEIMRGGSTRDEIRIDAKQKRSRVIRLFARSRPVYDIHLRSIGGKIEIRGEWLPQGWLSRLKRFFWE